MAEEKKGLDDEFAAEFAELEKALARLESDALAALQATPAAKNPAETDLQELERHLAESRESISNLFVHLARERRHARAAILTIKRRLQSLRRSGKAARGAPQPSALRPEEIPNFVGAARLAASHHLDAQLRALSDAPAADPATAIDECRRLVLILRLCGALASAPDPRDADSPAETVARRLKLWEPDFRRRRATLLGEVPRRLPPVVMPQAELDALVDAALGHALGRLPNGGMMLARAEEPNDAPARIVFQDNAADAPVIPSPDTALATGRRLEGLELALARELAERRGGSLIAAPVPSSRGLRLTLVFPAAFGHRPK